MIITIKIIMMMIKITIIATKDVDEYTKLY